MNINNYYKMLKSVFYVTVLLSGKTIATCSSGCNEQLIGDYVCNMECNNTFCDFDGGDCLDMNYFYNTNEITGTNNTNDINNTNDYSQQYYYIVGSIKDSCNLSNCPNLFFDDCEILQKHTNKWCNFDDKDHTYDICCAKNHTDCCENDLWTVILVSLSLFLLLISSCYRLFSAC